MSNEQVKRRLLTIFAADVAGFSRLVSDDEEGTLRRLNTCLAELSERIAAHDGTVVKTAGDSVLAAFDSPVEAVRCALATQRATADEATEPSLERRIAFRIGINLGDVVVRDDDMMGDGVNIAARLEAMAPPGGICMSAGVYDQIAGKVAVNAEDMGEQALRNMPRPVRVYRVAPDAEPLRETSPGSPRLASSGDIPAVDYEPEPRRFPFLVVSLGVALLAAALAIYFVALRTGGVPGTAVDTRPAAPAPEAAVAPGAPGAPQAGPAGLRRLFVPEQMPFVSDATRAKLRSEYALASDARAVSISRSTGGAWFVTGQPGADEASRRALDACVHAAPEPCELFAVNNEIVWDRPLPPMPEPPYLPPPTEAIVTPLDIMHIPLAGPGMRERLRIDYAPQPGAKAVAMARTGTLGFATGRPSPDEAARAALEFCGDMTGTVCAIIALGDSFIVPIPETVAVTGLFQPDRSPLINEPARQRLREGYFPRGGWKAVAFGTNGRVGISAGRDNEAAAIEDALADCRKQANAPAGGTAQDCSLQAIGIFTVAPK